MPTYEYRCVCGHQWTKRRVKVVAPLPVCPECGSEDVRKLVGGCSFQLKGRGWAKDGYGG